MPPAAVDIEVPEAGEIKKQDAVGHITSEAAVLEQAKVELQELKSKKKEKSEIEKKAESVSAQQIKKYWQGIESMRISKRGLWTLLSGLFPVSKIHIYARLTYNSFLSLRF